MTTEPFPDLPQPPAPDLEPEKGDGASGMHVFRKRYPEGCQLPGESPQVPKQALDSSSGLGEVFSPALHTAGIPYLVAGDVTEMFLWQRGYGCRLAPLLGGQPV